MNKRNHFRKTGRILLAAMMAAVMILSLAACGGGSEDTDFTWTRNGTYTDENNNYLSVLPSDDENYEGWYVGVMIGEDMYGWYIEQEGETLHGDLNGGSDEGDPYVVTISEEGEDGLMLEVEGGDTYHFTPEEEEFADDESGFCMINTDGSGQIAYAEEGETPEFSDEEPMQSAQITITEDSTYVLAAKADEGATFVKWTKDGEDYSTDEQITVEFMAGESADFVAVFE